MSEIVFIGTSDAFGAGGRRQTAILARGPNGTALLDCGATTGTGLAALGIAREEIDLVLISHFHADHFGGLPQLLLAACYEDARRRPLCIAGPAGVEARVHAAAQALGHPLAGRALPFPLQFVEVQAGAKSELGPVAVTPFRTHHSPEVEPHGFALALGDRRVVFSGDTGWFDGLPAHARGADLFVCECTFEARGWAYHLSLEELREHRADFDCHRMVLTHLGSAMSARRGDCGFETADDGICIRL